MGHGLGRPRRSPHLDYERCELCCHLSISGALERFGSPPRLSYAPSLVLVRKSPNSAAVTLSVRPTGFSESRMRNAPPSAATSIHAPAVTQWLDLRHSGGWSAAVDTVRLRRR